MNKTYKGTICKGGITELSTERILALGDVLRYTPNVKTYRMYHCGWEMDTRFWVLPDGRKFRTNHGSLEEFTDEDFRGYREQMEEHYKELKEM